MSIRLRYKVGVTISSTEAEEKDLGNSLAEVVNSELNEGGTWKTVIGAAATDVPVQLGNVASVAFISIRTLSKDPTLPPEDIALKFNSTGATPLTISPIGATAKEGNLVLTTSGLTSLYASNASSTVMEILVSVAGD